MQERNETALDDILKVADSYLKILRRQSPVRVLGPGKRAAIWVQGCSLACPGCIIPESWEESGGELIANETMAKWVLEQDVDGITISGGEPMEQAGSLAYLIDSVRKVRDFGVVCYTGYTIDRLLRQRKIEQLDLLARIDLLIDGPYVERLHKPLLWRGSANQRLLPLTRRYMRFLPGCENNTDTCAGLELCFEADGSFNFTGVPPEAGFRVRFESLLRERGVKFETKGREKV